MQPSPWAAILPEGSTRMNNKHIVRILKVCKTHFLARTLETPSGWAVSQAEDGSNVQQRRSALEVKGWESRQSSFQGAGAVRYANCSNCSATIVGKMEGRERNQRLVQGINVCLRVQMHRHTCSHPTSPLICSHPRSPLKCSRPTSPLKYSRPRNPRTCSHPRSPFTCFHPRSPLTCSCPRSPLTCSHQRSSLTCSSKKSTQMLSSKKATHMLS